MTAHISVIVNGAQGKMGKITCDYLQADSRFKLVATCGRSSNLRAEIHRTQADVVVDFTEASAAYTNTMIILEAGARAVIGTSGLNSDHVASLTTTCQALQKGAIIAPNFSLATVLLMQAAAQCAPYFEHVEIIEMHHDQKKDAPSSTAIKTAEMISKALKKPALSAEKKSSPASSSLSCPSSSFAPSSTTHPFPEARGACYHGIPIHSIRLPGLLAHQSILFGLTGEVLTLKQDTLSRECFMPGILLACEKIMHINHLIYGLESLLDFSPDSPLDSSAV